VARAIEELGYSPESTPGNSALVSNSVGVVITEPTTKSFGHPYFSTLIKGIYSALDDRPMVSADSRAAVPLHSAHAHDRRA
jgi:DNA-binding LacI/PurR family transcriptional regulator